MTHRHQLHHAQKGKCHYCDRPMIKAPNYPMSVTVEHLVPKSRGGTNQPHNIVGACSRCNNLRGDMPYAEFVERRTDLEKTAKWAVRAEKAKVQPRKTKKHEAIVAVMASQAVFRDRLPKTSRRTIPVEGASIGSLFPHLAQLVSRETLSAS